MPPAGPGPGAGPRPPDRIFATGITTTPFLEYGLPNKRRAPIVTPGCIVYLRGGCGGSNRTAAGDSIEQAALLGDPGRLRPGPHAQSAVDRRRAVSHRL